MTPAQIEKIMALVDKVVEANELYIDNRYAIEARAAVEAALLAPQAEPVPEPLFYYRPVCNGDMYEGPIWAKSVGGQMRMAENPPGSWKPLFGYPPDAQFTTPPEIDYDLLITACYGRTGQAQGTKGCVQFAKGAEWYREQIAATPSAPTAAEPDERQDFEAAYRARYPVSCDLDPAKFNRSDEGDYEDIRVSIAWAMWQARASKGIPT